MKDLIQLLLSVLILVAWIFYFLGTPGTTLLILITVLSAAKVYATFR